MCNNRLWMILMLCWGAGNVIAATAGPAEPAAFSTDQIAAASALREQAMAGSSAYASVESLTTEIGPRLAGSTADARAVTWAEARMRALGFDRVSLQPVTFPVWKRNAESAEVLSPAPQKLVIAALGWSSATPRGGITAEVVGFADFDALKTADPALVRGKIVYVSHQMKTRRDGSNYGPSVAVRVGGAEVAAQKGGVALLIRSVGTDSHRLAHAGVGLSATKLATDPVMHKRAIKLKDGSLIALTAVPAAALSNPDADQVERLLQLTQPLRVRLNIDTALAGEYTSYNVVGDVLGRELPDEWVVIGGHLDSWDQGTGAIDDGAGVAITMAAAELIAKASVRPRRSVRVVAFANEELGVFGGREYARANANMVHAGAAESDFGADRVYRFDYRVAAAFFPAMQQIAEVLHPLDIEKGGNDATGGADISALGALGTPIFELRQDGSDYFNLHHTADDTLNKIDAKVLDQNVAAYVVLTYLTADAEVPITAP